MKYQDASKPSHKLLKLTKEAIEDQTDRFNFFTKPYQGDDHSDYYQDKPSH